MLAVGSSIGGSLLFAVGLSLVIVSFVVAAGSLWWTGIGDAEPWLVSISALLSVMTASTIAADAISASLPFEVARRIFAAAGLVAIGLLTANDRRWRRRAVWAVVAGAVTLSALAPIVVPGSDIDVWSWTQTAVGALRHGIHPYTVTAPDLSGGKYDFGYTLTVYPYMPAVLIAYAPWVAVAGDFRYALATCLPITIGLLRATARRLAVDDTLTDAATLAVALHPAAPLLTAAGWTEPLLSVALALFVYLSVRQPRSVGAATALFLLPAIKQYVAAPPLMYLAMKSIRASRRRLIIGAAMAAATVVPFAVWQWQATLTGMVFQFFAQRLPRPDSHSLAAFLMVMTGRYPPRWVSVAAQFGVGGLAWLRVRQLGLGPWLIGSAVALFASFLVGWQAFVNYYSFVGSFLIFGAVALAANTRRP